MVVPETNPLNRLATGFPMTSATVPDGTTSDVRQERAVEIVLEVLKSKQVGMGLSHQ